MDIGARCTIITTWTLVQYIDYSSSTCTFEQVCSQRMQKSSILEMSGMCLHVYFLFYRKELQYAGRLDGLYCPGGGAVGEDDGFPN